MADTGPGEGFSLGLQYKTVASNIFRLPTYKLNNIVACFNQLRKIDRKHTDDESERDSFMMICMEENHPNSSIWGYCLWEMQKLLADGLDGQPSTVANLPPKKSVHEPWGNGDALYERANPLSKADCTTYRHITSLKKLIYLFISTEELVMAPLSFQETKHTENLWSVQEHGNRWGPFVVSGGLFTRGGNQNREKGTQVGIWGMLCPCNRSGLWKPKPRLKS